MDIAPQESQTISDDQELSKVLAGISSQTDDKSQLSNLAASLNDTDNTKEASAPVTEPAAPPATSTMPTPTFIAPRASTPSPLASTSDLDSIKKDALSELKPLVDKLTLSPEEMFDTYLLLIRSTDDKSLIAPAHAAAQKIADQTRKAQALLEIVKEIDYMSSLDK